MATILARMKGDPGLTDLCEELEHSSALRDLLELLGYLRVDKDHDPKLVLKSLTNAPSRYFFLQHQANILKPVEAAREQTFGAWRAYVCPRVGSDSDSSTGLHLSQLLEELRSVEDSFDILDLSSGGLRLSDLLTLGQTLPSIACFKDLKILNLSRNSFPIPILPVGLTPDMPVPWGLQTEFLGNLDSLLRDVPGLKHVMLLQMGLTPLHFRTSLVPDGWLIHIPYQAIIYGHQLLEFGQSSEDRVQNYAEHRQFYDECKANRYWVRE